MATKYGRGGFDHDAPGARAGTPARGSLDPKRRLLYIYIGILIFCVLLLVFHGLGLQQSLALLDPVQGVGTVANKTEIDGEFFVTVEVTVKLPDAPPRTLADNVHVPRDSHDRVEIGDQLRVVYQLNRDRTALIVRELSVAPSDPDRSTGTFEVQFAPTEPNDGP